MTPQARTVLVTGAAGHLGRAVARHFADLEMNRVLVARRVADLAPAGDLPPRTLLAEADLLDAGQVAVAVATGAEKFGRIDAWCHLAGGFRMGEQVHETKSATWDFLMDVNVRTFTACARAVVPHLLAQGRGSIVAVGAHAAAHGVARMGAYCASKSAMVRLVEAMSAELRTQGINVNCVLPTLIDTPDNRAAMPSADPAMWVAPADLAAVIGFLASDAARAIHGAALPVSGLS